MNNVSTWYLSRDNVVEVESRDNVETMKDDLLLRLNQFLNTSDFKVIFDRTDVRLILCYDFISRNYDQWKVETEDKHIFTFNTRLAQTLKTYLND